MQAIIIEDDPTFDAVLRRAIGQLGPDWSVTSCRSVGEAMQHLETSTAAIDLGLVDIGLPDASGIDIIGHLRKRFPEIPILVVSVISAERSVLAAIRAGARGYVLKDDGESQIASALRQAMQGNYPISPALARYLFKLAGAEDRPADLAELTPKELELLRQLSKGHSYAAAAHEMGIAVSTVQTHIRNLYRKLDVHSQVQAVTKAQERGLL